MNERIKELAAQANAWYPDGYPSSEGGDAAWRNLVIFEKQDLQEFAELIVKECIAQLDIVEVPTPIQAGLNLGKVAIKNHFGIAE